jgi:hypothetical protein
VRLRRAVRQRIANVRHPETMRDCVRASVIHRLLMPEAIYTLTPGMQFLIASKTEEEGEVTLEKFRRNYEKHVRRPYKDALKKVQHLIGNDPSNLFGPYNPDDFF